MRDCVFLVADTNMEAAFQGFLARDEFWKKLGCGRFSFDPSEDLFVAAGDNDPGLYTRGHELLRPYLNTHRHGVIVLDAEWDASPGAEGIEQHMLSHLHAAGWDEGRVAVIVIDPELENWFWQRDNPHVANALGFESAEKMHDHPELMAHWEDSSSKPVKPKECLEAVLEAKRKPRSSSLYRKVTKVVGVGGCEDPAFQQLKTVLQGWFPIGGRR